MMKRKIIKYIVFIWAFLCLAIFLFIKIAPALFHDVSISILKRSIGIKTFSESFADYNIKYISKGEGDTVLLIHGVMSNKHMWLPLIDELEGKHIIAIDLPGFGESTKRIDGNYTITQQKQRLSRFIDSLKLKSFHIAGSSMGGAIAAAYAYEHPEKVLSLGLFDPAGTYNCDTSDYFRLWKEENKNMFFIESNDELKNAIDFLFYDPPFIAKLINTSFLLDMKDSTYLKIFDDLFTEQFLLDSLAPSIASPTIIIWGEFDRVIDYSCGDVLSTSIKQSELFIVEKCGHLPMIERVKETTDIYNNFLNGLRLE